MAQKQGNFNAVLLHTFQIFLVAAVLNGVFSASVRERVPIWERPCVGSEVVSDNFHIINGEDSEEDIIPLSLENIKTPLRMASASAYSVMHQATAFIDDPDILKPLDEIFLNNFPRPVLAPSSASVETKATQVYETISRVYILLDERLNEEGNDLQINTLLQDLSWRLINILCTLHSMDVHLPVGLTLEFVPSMSTGAERSDRDQYDYVLAKQTISVLEGLIHYLEY